MSSIHYLSKQEREAFREMLLDEEKEISQWIEQKRLELNDNNNFHGDDAEIASDQEIYLSLKREILRKKDKREKIIQALRLLNNDDYGYCADCGIEIGKERLDINPSYTHCTACSDALFIKSKNFRKT